MDPEQRDRWRGERMKLWGVLLVVLLIVVFLLARHALETHGAGR